MLLRLVLEHGYFAGAEEAEHGAKGITITVNKHPILVLGKAMSSREHSSQ